MNVRDKLLSGKEIVAAVKDAIPGTRITTKNVWTFVDRANLAAVKNGRRKYLTPQQLDMFIPWYEKRQNRAGAKVLVGADGEPVHRTRELLNSYELCALITERLGMRPHAHGIWSYVRKSGVEPQQDSSGVLKITRAQAEHFITWRAAENERIEAQRSLPPREQKEKFNRPIGKAGRATPDQIERNRKKIAEMEAAVRAGKLKPKSMPSPINRRRGTTLDRSGADFSGAANYVGSEL
jgi:hypothetical protein